jgi:hypothetical protein
MFRDLIDHAKAAAGSLVARYFARISVAVPFVVALGFATAALTLMLIERYGQVTAYWIVAAAFTLIGVLAGLVVSVREQEEDRAEQVATAESGANVAVQAASELPVAALGALLSTPGGLAAALGSAKMLGRNLPLVMLMVLIGVLLLPGDSLPDTQSPAGARHEPDTGDPPPAGTVPVQEAA